MHPGPLAGNPMSTLRQLLNSQDAALGPWVPGRDPLEDALAAFAGAPGGAPLHPWMAGLVAGPASSPGGAQAQAVAAMSPVPSVRMNKEPAANVADHWLRRDTLPHVHTQ